MSHPLATRQSGFSLLELMIVIAIVAVLSAVAIPQYQDYLTRARWSVNLAETEALKLAITDCLHHEGGQPAACDSAEELGLGTLPAVTHASSLTVSSSSDQLTIEVTGNAAAASCRVRLVATLLPGQVSWQAVNAPHAGSTCSKRLTGISLQAS